MKFTFLIIFFLGFFKFMGLTQNDTIYHPFYGDVQMIEIRPSKQVNNQKGFIQIDKSQFSLDQLPKYLLRDRNGEITQKFNFLQGDLSDLKLRDVWLENFNLKPHQLKTKNTSSYVGNDDSGFNIVYPVFHCADVERGKCIDMKLGLIDTLGRIVLPIEYEQIRWIDSVFITQKNDKYFLYSHDFNLLLSDYQWIEYVNTFRDHLIVKNNEKYGLVHRSGKNLLLKEFDLIRNSKYMNGHYEFLKNGLWGFVDHSFTNYMEPFSPTPNLFRRDGHFQFMDEFGMWNVINSSGKVLLRSKLEMYQVISQDRFLVFRYVKDIGYERFLVDSRGIVLTDLVYYDIWRMNGNTLIAGYDASIHDDSNIKKSSKWVLLDENGQKKSPRVYKSIQLIDENFLGVWTYKNKLHVIDSYGNDVLGYEIQDVYKYSDHLYKVKIKDEHQFLDLNDPKYISKRYDQLQCVKDNRIGVQNDGLWGFVDAETYREILPPIADQIICFQNGIACYKRKNKWIIIDSIGRPLSKDLFDNVKQLENGFVIVEIKGFYGVVDRFGKYAIPPIYDEIKFVIQKGDNSYAGVGKYGKYGIINLRNEIVYPFIFESCAELTYHAAGSHGRKDGYYAFLVIKKRNTIEYYSLNFDSSKDHIRVQANPHKGFRVFEEECTQQPSGKCFGVVNWDGMQIIPPVYAHIKDLRYNTFEIYSSKGVGLVDTNGRILIPPVYKYLYELAGDSTLLQVGRHQGCWGLYARDGRKIADTLYGGFDSPVYSLIPFYADFNYRFEESKWVHDPKKIGFMNRNGEIIIDALYDKFYVDSPQKGMIRLIYGDQTCVVNGDGELQEGKLAQYELNQQHQVDQQNVQPDRINRKSAKKKRKRIRWV